MILLAVMVPHPPIAVPEVGGREIRKIQDTENGFDQAARLIAQAEPELIILFSPHAIMYRDWFNISAGEKAEGSFASFRAPQVKFEETYDTEFIRRLEEVCAEQDLPAGTRYDRMPELDHGTMVPLYFLEKHWKNFKLVRIGLSGLPLSEHYRFGKLIRQVIEETGRRTVIIGSGDLAHCQKRDGPYGYRKEGPRYDRMIMETMGKADFKALLDYDDKLLEASMECGHRSFCMMAGTLDGYHVTPHVWSHEATFGVGYGIVTYEIGEKEEAPETEAVKPEGTVRKEAEVDPYVKLARASVESWVGERIHMKIPKDTPEEILKQHAGAFVTIHEDGQLRGCIGTILPCQKNLAEEIITNAISASTRDPRFAPIRKDELDKLVIGVDVLTKPEDIDSPEQLDVKKYGVICSTRDGRRGLLLPDLEGVDTVDFQIEIACRKGGIDPLRDRVRLQRFEVIRHE